MARGMGVRVAPASQERDSEFFLALDPRTDPVPRRCVATLDAVESASLGVLVERLGRLSDTRMREMCAALAVAVDC